MNLAVIIASFIADLASKNKARNNLREGETITVAEGKLYFKRTRNYGFAANIKSDNPQFVKQLSVISIASAFLYFTVFLKNTPKIVKTGCSLIMGGALGNFADRLRDGYVTDFICFKKGRTTVFNLADFFIFIGSGILLIYGLFGSER